MYQGEFSSFGEVEFLWQKHFATKGGGYKIDHLSAGSPFSQASVDKNVFRSFSEKEKVDLERNTSGFVFFQASLNYTFVNIGLPKFNPLATCKEMCGNQRQ